MEDKKTKVTDREEAVLKFWKENKIFEKSLDKYSPKGEYVFFEGPPTANGKPGIHHLEARAFKDAIPRYKTMRGYKVRRKGGWDTHGLPVELQVEKKLGLSSKKDIENYGIKKFNKECKESVWEYTDLWSKFTERIGYWVDQENPYVTYHNDYIESVWNVVKEADKQNLLFKDYKIVSWCPRCGTALSSHELAQGYQDVKDLSVYVKFKLIAPEVQPLEKERGCTSGPTYILAWTTTPWTLLGNVALAVGEGIDYIKIKVDSEFLILAKSRLGVIESEYEIIEEFKGKDLIGLEYEPLYPYFEQTISGEEKSKLNKAFKIYGARFVTTEDGTGVVHTAVMYGQDDFDLGTEIGLPKHHMVGLDGKYLSGTGPFEGRFVRDEEVAVDIIKDLAHRGLLLKKEKYEHSYPHCWRCKTALIYYARDSWYIKTTALRDKMVAENKKINWEPSYIKEGRFGEWLSDIKDWAISRERYWGTPLPIWTCDKCGVKEVIGSLEDLKSNVKKSGNKYFLMRHGESESNLKGIVSVITDNNDKLTLNGRNKVAKSAENLKSKKIDLVFASPLLRTKETALIVSSVLEIDKNKIIFDDRIREIYAPLYEGKTWSNFFADFPVDMKNFNHINDDNESLNDVKKRSMDFIYDLESKYKDKNILIITHAGPIWLMEMGALALDTKEIVHRRNIRDNLIVNAEVRKLNFSFLPHNENYELDLHKPFIDDINLSCKCGGRLERTKEVMDVWLDSGCMPFAQDHYPFENKSFVKRHYPADFICEAIDQTRGWFYTLHAVGAIMGKGRAYKNVVCLGHILDANGKKMSKSLGNIVDPWEMMDKYGADTLRLWMYSVNQPGESKNFDEKTVSELNNKVFNLLYNVLTFYELYRDKDLENFKKLSKRKNVLDKWIIYRLRELINEVTKKTDEYKLLEPVRAMRDFIDDLSTWYLRRSRERIKGGDIESKKTLYFVLKNLSKVMAPFAPFTSEDIWQKLKNNKDKESIHLEKWPKSGRVNISIIEEMNEARRVVTLGLQNRQKAGIPVRQPLSKIIINNKPLKNEYIEIIKDELNIKEIEFKSLDKDTQIVLETNITEELKQEGNYRELVRVIQDMRKKSGLNPSDLVNLIIKSSKEGEEFINKFKSELIKTVIVKEIKVEDNDGEEIKIDDILFKIKLIK